MIDNPADYSDDRLKILFDQEYNPLANKEDYQDISDLLWGSNEYNKSVCKLINGDDDVDMKKMIEHSIKTDPRNPLFGEKEEEDFIRDNLINELISLYKKLYIERGGGTIMSKGDKTRLRLIDQLARKNRKTVNLAVKLRKQYEDKFYQKK